MRGSTTASAGSTVARAIESIALGLGFAAMAWLMVLHLRMVASSAPQEMREGAVIWITGLLLAGRNPYALEELPAAANLYGIGYHLAVLPFADLIGNGFFVHRLVSALAILASAALIHDLCRRSGADRRLSLLAATLVYTGALYFVAPLARPDALGLFLSIASLYVLVRWDAGPRAFLIASVLALAALATKVYFAYPPFVAAAFVFLFRSWRLGLVYGIGVGLASIALLCLLTIPYPSYLNVAVLANQQSAAYSVAHLIRQTADWLIYSLPLTVGLAGTVLVAWRRWTIVRARPADRTIAWAPSLPGFTAMAGAATVLVVLGGHPGAHMTYLFQLITPGLAVAVIPSLAAYPWLRAAVALALPVAVLLNAQYFPVSFARFAHAEAGFAALERDLASARTPLGGPEVAGLLALSGRPVWESGQSEYFGGAVGSLPLLPTIEPRHLAARWDWFQAAIRDGLQDQLFDRVVRSRRPGGVIPPELLQQSYRPIATHHLDFVWAAQRWPVDLWAPKR